MKHVIDLRKWEDNPPRKNLFYRCGLQITNRRGVDSSEEAQTWCVVLVLRMLVIMRLFVGTMRSARCRSIMFTKIFKVTYSMWATWHYLTFCWNNWKTSASFAVWCTTMADGMWMVVACIPREKVLSCGIGIRDCRCLIQVAASPLSLGGNRMLKIPVA